MSKSREKDQEKEKKNTMQKKKGQTANKTA